MFRLISAGILIIGSLLLSQESVHPLVAVEVTIIPAKATVFSGETQTFVATVAGTDNHSVDWSIDEKDGGTVSTTGIYTAPKLQGIYHVIATSRSSPDAKAVATITVLAYCDPRAAIRLSDR
jgi:hypothetical protein